MLRAWTFVFVALISNQALAADDGAFACYKTANELNQNSALSFDGKFALNYRTDYSFDILSAGKVANCDIAKVSSEHHGGPPYRVQVLISGQPHYFLYSRESAKEVKVNTEDLTKFPKVDCKSAGSHVSFNTFETAIQNQLNQAQEICDAADDGGMGGSRNCYSRFEQVLRTCAHIKQPALKRYASERLRSLKAHRNFDDSFKADKPTGNSLGDGDATK